MSDGLDVFLQSVKKLVRNDQCITSPALLSEAIYCTFNTENPITAILYPESTEEVSECVRLASKHHIPLYPISKGKNWGYGSNMPVTKGNVLLSLERMSQIIEYDDVMGFIRVEPGVTFQQSYEFLQEKDSPFLAPSIGSTPAASLIGNALERGIGKGKYGDRFQHSCHMEVVLPNGSIIQTGFGHIEHAHSANTLKYGIGPSLDGLFTQSNFGIVTKMTFWLQPKPRYFQAVFYTVRDEKKLPLVVDALRQLRLEGTLSTNSTLSNDYRILAMKQVFPKHMSDKTQMVPDDYLDHFRQTHIDGSSWVGDDAILAPSYAIGKAQRKRIRQLLGPHVDRLTFIDESMSWLMRTLQKPIKMLLGIDVRDLIHFHKNSLYLGKPMIAQIAMCYFRKTERNVADPNPDRDGCGVMWCSPSSPFEGKHVKKVLEILYQIYHDYQLEPNVGLNMMSERNIAYTAALIYDRENQEEEARAMACYKAMYQALYTEGYVPYRHGIQSMEKMTSESEPYNELIQSIKQTLDPSSVIAPSRYGIHGQ